MNEFGLLKAVWTFFIISFISSLSSGIILCAWFSGTHPVQDPPEEHLMESSNDLLVDDIEAESINGAG